jgi:hypothetical protein
MHNNAIIQVLELMEAFIMSVETPARDRNTREDNRGTRWLGLICGPNKDFALEYQVLNWVLVTSALHGYFTDGREFFASYPITGG